jgi:hypothetical protein
MAGIRKFGWLPKPSAWKETQAWRSRRAAFNADSINANDNLNSLFAKANSNKIEGMAKLAAEAAVKRIKLAAKAKFDTIANTKVAGVPDTKVDKKV